MAAPMMISKLLSTLIVLCTVVEIVELHMCLLSPPQRGSLQGINKKGTSDCILLNSPCGGRPSQPNTAIILRPGQNFTVTFQKNLDHWVQSSPGGFYISIGSEDAEKFAPMTVIPDKGEPSLTLYSVNVTIPAQLTGLQALQVIYMTNNPNAPKAFYQCADVYVAKVQ